ncbi:unnamed protein product [Peniophora sp. CBMAI 1063]|nr:unnamed protein product [Peniophora sp. CBMAI 1063]
MPSTRVPRATIHHVPLEVLDDILEQAFPPEDNPLRFSHVCQLWYRRCQRPTLWTSLSTEHSTVAMMDESIIRSGTKLLDVRITTARRNRRPKIRHLVWIAMQYIHRIRSLQCSAVGSDLAIACESMSFATGWVFAPQLRKLDVKVRGFNPLLHWLGSVLAPALEKGYIYDGGATAYKFLDLWRGSCLRVVSLEIIHGFAIEELLQLLGACPGLRNLGLHCGKLTRSATSQIRRTSPVALSKLVYLAVAMSVKDLTDFLDSLDIGALAQIYIMPEAEEDDVHGRAIHPHEDQTRRLMSSILRILNPALYRGHCTSISLRERLTFGGTVPSPEPNDYFADGEIAMIGFSSSFGRGDGLLDFAREMMFAVIAGHSTLRTVDVSVPVLDHDGGWILQREYPINVTRAAFAEREGSTVAALFSPESWSDTCGIPLPALTLVSLRCVSDALSRPATLLAISSCLRRFRAKAGNSFRFALVAQEVQGNLIWEDGTSTGYWAVDAETPATPSIIVYQHDLDVPARPDLSALSVPRVNTSVTWTMDQEVDGSWDFPTFY